MDDGFQHRGLHRDVDLLLLDGVRKWGNGRMLPLGDLREPMDSAKRASALVVTRGSRADRPSIEAWWARHGSGGPIFWIDFAITGLRDFSTNQRLALPAQPGPLYAFCALGHPEAFYADLLVAGLSWLGTRSFPDHKPIGARDLQLLQEEALAMGAQGLVCTEKDAVKFGVLKGLQLPLWIAEQRVLGGDALLGYVLSQLTER
jgi:tetraacyldisaccharide 4'-kinase